MTITIIVGASLIMLSSIINWKKTKPMPQIACSLWILYISVIHFFPFQNFSHPLEQDLRSVVLYLLIILLVSQLIIIPSILIPYLKNRNDVDVIKRTVKQLIQYSVLMIIFVAAYIFVVVVFL